MPDAEYWERRWEAAVEREDDAAIQIIQQQVRIQELTAELARISSSDEPVVDHWDAVSKAALVDLSLISEAAALGDDSPVPSGSVSAAVNRLEILLSSLAHLDGA